MIGGRFVMDNPGLVDQCGAHGTAQDAQQAVAAADALVPVHQRVSASLA